MKNTKTKMLNLYPDPNCTEATAKLAEILGVDFDEVLLTNGSDEILNFAFMAFCDDEHPAAFADIAIDKTPETTNVSAKRTQQIFLIDLFMILLLYNFEN